MNRNGEAEHISLPKPSIDSLVLQVNGLHYDPEADQIFVKWFEKLEKGKVRLLLRRLGIMKIKISNVLSRQEQFRTSSSMKPSQLSLICLVKSPPNNQSVSNIFLSPNNMVRTGWPMLVHK